jgi:hypothetical protein
MEDYFNQDFDVKLKDARPEYGYQVPFRLLCPCSVLSLEFASRVDHKSVVERTSCLVILLQ